MTAINVDVRIGGGQPPSTGGRGKSYVLYAPRTVVNTSAGKTIVPVPDRVELDSNGTATVTLDALPAETPYVFQFEVDNGYWKSSQILALVPASGTHKLADLVVLGDDFTPPAWYSQVINAKQVIEENVGEIPEIVQSAVTEDIAGRDLVEGSDPRVLTNLPRESGYIYAVTDSQGRLLFGVRPDGSFYAPALEAGAGSIDLPALSPTVQSLVMQSMSAESGAIWAVTDSQGRMLAYITGDGTFMAPKFGAPVWSRKFVSDSQYVAESTVDANGVNQLTVRRVSGGEVTIRTTGTVDRVEPALDGAGALLYGVVQNGEVTRCWSPAAGPLTDAPYRPGRNLDQWGDSLTENGTTFMGARIATALGLTVRNFGMGGQASAAIAGRFGTEPVTVTLTGGSVPDSGAAAVSAVSPDIVQAAGAGARNVTGKVTTDDGTVIEGVLSKAGSGGAITFTRSTAGTAKAATGARPFVSSYDPVNAVTIWVGRNNNLGSEGAATRARIAAMVAKIRTYVKQYAVISVLPLTSETTGSAGRATLDAFNAELAAAHPGRFIDLTSYLTSAQALTDAGVTPTAQDLTDLGNGVMPQSLRSDDRHINQLAYYTVVDFVLVPWLASKGWFTS